MEEERKEENRPTSIADATTMVFDADLTRELRTVYDEEVRLKHQTFYWHGHSWFTPYVGYLLEYLEGKFGNDKRD